MSDLALSSPGASPGSVSLAPNAAANSPVGLPHRAGSAFSSASASAAANATAFNKPGRLIEVAPGRADLRPDAGRVNLGAGSGQRAERRTQTAPADRVELSKFARHLETLRSLPDVRLERVARLRESLQDGTYETDAKLDAAIEKLAEEEGL